METRYRISRRQSHSESRDFSVFSTLRALPFPHFEDETAESAYVRYLCDSSRKFAQYFFAIRLIVFIIYGADCIVSGDTEVIVVRNIAFTFLLLLCFIFLLVIPKNTCLGREILDVVGFLLHALGTLVSFVLQTHEKHDSFPLEFVLVCASMYFAPLRRTFVSFITFIGMLIMCLCIILLSNALITSYFIELIIILFVVNIVGLLMMGCLEMSNRKSFAMEEQFNRIHGELMAETSRTERILLSSIPHSRLLVLLRSKPETVASHVPVCTVMCMKLHGMESACSGLSARESAMLCKKVRGTWEEALVSVATVQTSQRTKSFSPEPEIVTLPFFGDVILGVVGTVHSKNPEISGQAGKIMDAIVQTMKNFEEMKRFSLEKRVHSREEGKILEHLLRVSMSFGVGVGDCTAGMFGQQPFSYGVLGVPVIEAMSLACCAKPSQILCSLRFVKNTHRFCKFDKTITQCKSCRKSENEEDEEDRDGSRLRGRALLQRLKGTERLRSIEKRNTASSLLPHMGSAPGALNRQLTGSIGNVSDDVPSLIIEGQCLMSTEHKHRVDSWIKGMFSAWIEEADAGVPTVFDSDLNTHVNPALLSGRVLPITNEGTVRSDKSRQSEEWEDIPGVISPRGDDETLQVMDNEDGSSTFDRTYGSMLVEHEHGSLSSNNNELGLDVDDAVSKSPSRSHVTEEERISTEIPVVEYVLRSALPRGDSFDLHSVDFKKPWSVPTGKLSSRMHDVDSTTLRLVLSAASGPLGFSVRRMSGLRRLSAVDEYASAAELGDREETERMAVSDLRSFALSRRRSMSVVNKLSLRIENNILRSLYFFLLGNLFLKSEEDSKEPNEPETRASSVVSLRNDSVISSSLVRRMFWRMIVPFLLYISFSVFLVELTVMSCEGGECIGTPVFIVQILAACLALLDVVFGWMYVPKNRISVSALSLRISSYVAMGVVSVLIISSPFLPTDETPSFVPVIVVQILLPATGILLPMLYMPFYSAVGGVSIVFYVAHSVMMRENGSLTWHTLVVVSCTATFAIIYGFYIRKVDLDVFFWTKNKRIAIYDLVQEEKILGALRKQLIPTLFAGKLNKEGFAFEVFHGAVMVLDMSNYYSSSKSLGARQQVYIYNKLLAELGRVWNSAVMSGMIFPLRTVGSTLILCTCPAEFALSSFDASLVDSTVMDDKKVETEMAGEEIPGLCILVATTIRMMRVLNELTRRINLEVDASAAIHSGMCIASVLPPKDSHMVELWGSVPMRAMEIAHAIPVGSIGVSHNVYQFERRNYAFEEEMIPSVSGQIDDLQVRLLKWHDQQRM